MALDAARAIGQAMSAKERLLAWTVTALGHHRAEQSITTSIKPTPIERLDHEAAVLHAATIFAGARPRHRDTAIEKCQEVVTATEDGHDRRCLQEEKNCPGTICFGGSLQEMREIFAM